MLALLAVLQAPATGDSVSWAFDTLKWCLEQFQQKNFMPAIGGFVMILVYAFNKLFKDKVSPKALPLLAAGLGCLLAVATNLASMAAGNKPQDWLAAIATGFMAGAAASGLWSLLGKKAAELLGLEKPQAPAAPPAE